MHGMQSLREGKQGKPIHIVHLTTLLSGKLTVALKQLTHFVLEIRHLQFAATHVDDEKISFLIYRAISYFH